MDHEHWEVGNFLIYYRIADQPLGSQFYVSEGLAPKSLVIEVVVI